MSRALLFTFLTIFISFVAVGEIHAQSSQVDVAIEMIPLNPEPGQTVYLKAVSYGADLSQSQLTWSYGGKLISRGTGITEITIIAPQSGAVATVSLLIKAVGFEDTTSIITLRPGSVDLLWEAIDAYVPPFYKGKALLPVGGQVRMTAITGIGAPKGISYTWSRNDSVLGDYSGYEKSSLLFTQNMLNAQEKIDVSVKGGTFDGTASMKLNPGEPKLIVYQNNEGYIDLSTGYDSNIGFNKPGILLRFEPYFFSVNRSVGQDLIFETMLDGELVYPSKPNELGLSRPKASGQSILKLAIKTVEYGLQHLEKTFTLNF